MNHCRKRNESPLFPRCLICWEQGLLLFEEFVGLFMRGSQICFLIGSLKSQFSDHQIFSVFRGFSQMTKYHFFLFFYIYINSPLQWQWIQGNLCCRGDLLLGVCIFLLSAIKQDKDCLFKMLRINEQKIESVLIWIIKVISDLCHWNQKDFTTNGLYINI